MPAIFRGPPSDADGATRCREVFVRGVSRPNPQIALAYVGHLQRLHQYWRGKPLPQACSYRYSHHDPRIFCITQSIELELAFAYLQLAAVFNRCARDAVGQGTLTTTDELRQVASYLHQARYTLTLLRQHWRDERDAIQRALQMMQIAMSERVQSTFAEETVRVREDLMRIAAHECFVAVLYVLKRPDQRPNYLMYTAESYGALLQSMPATQTSIRQFVQLQHNYWLARTYYEAGEKVLRDAQDEDAPYVDDTTIDQAYLTLKMASHYARNARTLAAQTAKYLGSQNDTQALTDLESQAEQRLERHRRFVTHVRARDIGGLSQYSVLPGHQPSRDKLLPLEPQTRESSAHTIASLRQAIDEAPEKLASNTTTIITPPDTVRAKVAQVEALLRDVAPELNTYLRQLSRQMSNEALHPSDALLLAFSAGVLHERYRQEDDTDARSEWYLDLAETIV